MIEKCAASASKIMWTLLAMAANRYRKTRFSSSKRLSEKVTTANALSIGLETMAYNIKRMTKVLGGITLTEELQPR
jgi:hypothetical protein